MKFNKYHRGFSIQLGKFNFGGWYDPLLERVNINWCCEGPKCPEPESHGNPDFRWCFNFRPININFDWDYEDVSLTLTLFNVSINMYYEFDYESKFEKH